MLFEFIENMNDTNVNDLYDAKEGFLRGNMFPKLYDQYKNYEPKNIKPTTEREMMLLNIMKLDFAINDLNLYLDLNPDDQEMFEIFKMYVKKYKKSIDEYQEKYQVLELCNDTKSKYSWMNGAWPWEDNYV